MKLYAILIKSLDGVVKDYIKDVIYTEENINEALDFIKLHSDINHAFKYELMELTPVLEIKPECDMSEDELKIYKETISAMDDDLNKIIEYDEWAGREFGETRVDYWYSAKNLYNSGYRKITKIEK